MITRSDLNEEAFEKLIRNELIDTLSTLDEGADLDALKAALNIVIAYYSVPGTYEDGKYDCP